MAFKKNSTLPPFSELGYVQIGILSLLLCAFLYFLLVFSNVPHNGAVTTKDTPLIGEPQ